MKIALVSLNQVWEDKEVNFNLCKKYIAKASKYQTDLVIFPEMTLTSYSINVGKIAEDENNSNTIKWFQKLAKEQNIAILFGVVLKKSKIVKNYSVFVDNKGTILVKYAKIHPFSFANEDKYFEAGNSLEIVEYKNHKIGLTTCYDLRFPELYSVLSSKSDMVINIANWPAKRMQHWEILLKARAIENQTYIIGVNRIGKDGNGLEYVESSHIFDANGDEVEYEEEQNIKFYTIDKKWTKNFRETFLTIADRKEILYREFLGC